MTPINGRNLSKVITLHEEPYKIMVCTILVLYIDNTVSTVYEEHALRLISLLNYLIFRHVHSCLKLAHK
jgi:hypothetical protein